MDVQFDASTSRVTYAVPAEADARFFGTFNVKTDTSDDFKPVSFSASIKQASLTNDFSFKKPMLEKHLEYLRRLHLQPESTEQLAFQIVDHSFVVDLESFVFNDTVGIERLVGSIGEHVTVSYGEQLRKRIGIINDPQEIMEDLEFENFSLQHLQTSFRHLMSKLKFNLPDKLYLPVTHFVMSNYVANQIKVTETNVVISYDPRSLGLMSKKVQQRL